MSGVEDVKFSVWHIPAVSFRLREVERWVVLPPYHLQARPPLGHPSLPRGVRVNVSAVVVEEVGLNVGLTRLAKKCILIGPQIRVVALDPGIIS
jgi:hypothetical protein